MEHVLVAVDEFDETLYATRERKILFFSGALVDELNLDAIIQKRELAQSAGQNVVVVLDGVESLCASQEVDLCPAAL